MPTRSKSRNLRAGTALRPVRQTLRRLEREGSRLVARARAEAARYLSASQDRALGSLMKQARRLGTDIERRMQRGLRAFEGRAEKVLTRVEHRAARALSARALPDVVVPGALDRHEAEALRDAGAPVRAREGASGLARAGDRYGQVLGAVHQQDRRVGEARGVADGLPLAQPLVVGGVE